MIDWPDLTFPPINLWNAPKMGDIETWKPVPNFEGFYEVSSIGRIRSVDRYVKCSRGSKLRLWKGKLLKTNNLVGRGYVQVNLSANGTTTVAYLHRLVASAFIPNPECKPEVNHKDSVKTNNAAYNLEWVTTQEHAIFGYYVEGKLTPRKINREQAEEVRKLLETGMMQKEIAAMYGISQSAVSLINLRKVWND